MTKKNPNFHLKSYFAKNGGASRFDAVDGWTVSCKRRLESGNGEEVTCKQRRVTSNDEAGCFPTSLSSFNLVKSY